MKKNVAIMFLVFLLSGTLFCNDFALVKGGKIAMRTDLMQRKNNPGCNEEYEVTVNDFYMCVHEVTQKEWTEIMGNNPSHEKSDNYPVNIVNWYDAILYCNKRSVKEGLTPCYTISDSKQTIEYRVPVEGTVMREEIDVVICDWNANGYRLPTEAEWEYAARAGGKEATFFAGSDNIDEVAWYYKYIGATIHDVMKKKPNSLGIYDMSGNVGEWCWDWSDDYNFDDTDNPKGPEKGIEKIYRGGGWDSEVWEQSFDEECSVSKRYAWKPTWKNDNLGFRVARNSF